MSMTYRELPNKDEFIRMIAKICYFAQEYSRDWERNLNIEYLEPSFEHVSHVIACFISQYTSEGVESNIVLDQLVNEIWNLDEWCAYFEKVINDYE